MKKVGLVLAGGGGRGAYHIGVWKALRENGLDRYVSAISGTSVGGLNAALFLQGDLEKAMKVWENISVEKILTPRYAFNSDMKKYTYRQLKEKHSGIYCFLRDGLADIIDKNLQMSVFDKSSINCYMTCRRTQYRKDMDEYEKMYTNPDGTKSIEKYVKGKATYFNMRAFHKDDRKKILLATSAMPFIFPKEKINNYYYMDGGSAENLPVEPLYSIEGCRIIIVVHLTTNDGLQKIKKEDYPNAVILEIRPRQEQGGLFAGILDFTAEGAKRRIQQGYDDTIEMFCNIEKIVDNEGMSIAQWEDALREEKSANQRIEDGWKTTQDNLQKIY